MSRYSQYNFTDDFQDTILACLIRYPDEFFAFGEMIKPQYFNGPEAAELVFRLLDYKKEFNKYPNFTVLGNYAFHKAARANLDHAKDTLDYVEKLSNIDTSDKEAIAALCLQFVKERAIYDGIRKIHGAQTEGNLEEINPVTVMQEAMAVGTNFRSLGLSLYHQTDAILDKISDHSYGVMPGYAEFEKLWKFGWCPGWLIVLLAPPKRYKTGFAINLALNIAKSQDADVLYYACEISQELAAFRAICNLTGWTQDQFFDGLEKGKMVARAAVKKELWGNVWFKGYPSKSTAISEIKAHARQVISYYNLKPRAIVIDYAETVRPDSVDKKAPDWRQQADIYTQARAMGDEFGCCMILPDRCTRETVGKKVPSMKSFQGAFEKAGIVDIAIGLCATDAEYRQKIMRYFVFLNRHGDALKHYRGKVDPQRMQFTVDKEIDYIDDDEEGEARQWTSNRNKHSRSTIEGAELTQKDGGG